MNKNYIWVEKYRPTSINDYVWKNDKFKQQIQKFINDGEIPHILLSGTPGTGKTTLARVLLNELNVDSADKMEINASNETGVETMRNKVVNFASTIGFGDMKYIILDESDYLTPNSQAILRNLMEDYSAGCRFILTCNYENKIIPALKSRSHHFHLGELSEDEFIYRVADILMKEGIDVNEDNINILYQYVNHSYPDLRKCINLLQSNCYDNKLQPLAKDEKTSQDYMYDMVDYIKKGEINKARNIIIQNAKPEEYVDVYRFLYNNLDLWFNDEHKQNKALIVIRDGLYKHSIVADPEINLSACLVELELLTKE